MKLKYRIEFDIDEAIYGIAKEHLIKIGEKPTKKKIETLIKRQLYFRGEAFIIEPTLNDSDNCYV